MNNYNTFLEHLTDAIEKKQEITTDFEIQKIDWYSFLHGTEIGQMINQNDYFICRDSKNEIKGIYIKLDDELYAQITLLTDMKKSITTVQFELFNVSKLKNKIENQYINQESSVDKTEIEQEIQNLDYFEIIFPRKYRR